MPAAEDARTEAPAPAAAVVAAGTARSWRKYFLRLLWPFGVPGSNSNTAGVRGVKSNFHLDAVLPSGSQECKSREAWRQCVETTKYTGAGSEQW